MAGRRDKEAATPVPHWVSDWLHPLLTGDEVKLHGYVMRRTWGAHQKSARISRSQMMFGVVRDGKYIDCGVGLSAKGLRRAMKALLEFGVIHIVGRWSWSEELPWELAPAWEGKVDRAGLIARRREEMASNARRAANFGGEYAATLPECLAALESPVVAGQTQQAFEEQFHIVYPVADLNRVMEGAVRPVDEARAQRTISKLKIPKFIQDGSFSAEEWARMTDVFLRLSGQDGIANVNDPDVAHLADKALADAHDCATMAVAAGARTAADLAGLEAYWLKSWQRKKAKDDGGQVTPTLGQLRALVTPYLKERQPARAASAPAVPRADVRPTASSLEGWTPRRKGK